MNNKLVYLNTFYQIAAKIISAGISVIVTVLITRNLGAEFFGEYSIITGYVFTFLVFTDFGINITITKNYALDENLAKDNLIKILGLRIFMGLGITLLSYVLLLFFPYSYIIKFSILVLGPVLVLNSMYKTSEIIFMSYRRYKLHVASVTLGSIAMLLLFLFLISTKSTNLLFFVIPTLIGYFLITLSSLVFIRGYLNFKQKIIDFKYWKYALLDAAPFGISLLLNTLMVQLDKILLSVLSTPTSVGYYSLSYKLFEFILVIPTFFMNSVYANLIVVRNRSKKEYKTIFGKNLKILSLAAILITVVSFVSGPVLIPMIWSDVMSSSILPFLILTGGSLIFYLTSPFSWKLVTEGKQRYLPIIYGLVMILNVILNIVFIPIYDYIASAYITVFSEFLVLLMLIYINFNNKRK